MAVLFGFIFLCLCVPKARSSKHNLTVKPSLAMVCEELCKYSEQCASILYMEKYCSCNILNPGRKYDYINSQNFQNRKSGFKEKDHTNSTNRQFTNKMLFSERQIAEQKPTITGGITVKTTAELGEFESGQHNQNINLHQACRKGKLDVVKYILSQGVEDINSRGKKGRTPVMEAALKHQMEVFNYLVEQGCDLSLLDDNRNNVLHCACYGGNLGMVRYILSLNVVDIESKGRNGRTPVMYAVRYGHKSVVDFLVSRNCNLKARSAGNTILHVACGGGHVDMVKYIISLGVSDIESKGRNGKTPVLYAARYGHKSVVDFLVSKHCNLKAVDNDGNNVIHLACYRGHGKLVKPLLSLGVLTGREKNKKGQTPAQIAKRHNKSV